MWILFSDMLVNAFFPDKASLSAVQTYKGWAFVVSSGLLFYFMIFREFRGKVKANVLLTRQKDFSNSVLDSAGVYVAVIDGKGTIARINEKFEKLFASSGREIVGESIYDVFLNPSTASVLRSAVESIRDIDSEQVFESGCTVSGKTLHIRWSLRFLASWKEENDYFVLTGVDITKVVESERNATKRLNDIQALHEIDLAVSYNIELEKMLDVFLEKSISRLEVDGADIYLLSEDNKLRFTHGMGLLSDKSLPIDLPLEGTVPGKVVLTGESYSGPLHPDPGSNCPRLAMIKEMKISEYHAVPLQTRGKTLGVLEVFSVEERERDSEWHDFLITLAGQGSLAIDIAIMIESLKASNKMIKHAYDQTLEGLAMAMDLRDIEMEGHSRRVTELSMALAREMGLNGEELENFYRGALLHDIGKISVPDEILFKKGPLDENEWEIMKSHTVYARKLLSQIDYLVPSLDIPYCHHERWDGSGYPRGLKGEEIPLSARIFTVADVYDALTSERRYKHAWPEKEALKYLRENSGKLFDERIVDRFLKIVKN
ncbi:MAG: HD domain-containing phosphohydrolase [Mesotoga infera]